MRRYIYIFGLTVLFWGTSCADFINIQPENATMDPIIVDKVQIHGKVIGLLRLMR